MFDSKIYNSNLETIRQNVSVIFFIFGNEKEL